MSFALLRTLVPYLRRYRRQYALGFTVLLVNVAVFTTIPYILKLAIDGLSRGLTRGHLADLCLLLVAAVLARGLLQYWQRLILITTSRDIEYDLRNDLLWHLEKLSMSFFQEYRTGDLMARSTNDLNAVRNMLGPGIMYSANAVVLVVVVLAILLRLDWRLTLIAFIPAPAISLCVQWFGKRIHDRFERIQAMFSTLATRVEENLTGLRVVRAFAREPQETEAFERLNADYVRRNLRLVKLSGSFDPLLQFLLGIAFVLVLWFGGRAVLEHQISLGSFVAFNAYMMQMSFPMIALGFVINIVQRGTASLERIQQIFRTQPAIADGPGTDFTIRELEGTIEFCHLTFSYNGGPPVLKDINLRIPAGSTVALVGHTGAGKSTLASLLPRFYDAAPGMVRVDGRDIATIPVEVLRRSIGMVPQEAFLFSDTLRANIAFGVADATDEQVEAAANVASLAVDVADFPEGYRTRVGERGLTLSGGQKQRTALARAVLRDPKILILDDALSSVDTLTEERILERLQEVTRGRTTLLISHRISTIRGADHIVVLQDGAIVEQGTHAELIGLGGVYAELYEKQLLEEELEKV
ncbi:MAG TPA: ABC transporter ATP-binding protein [Terriglobales bacterium]|nr:ABC transporter ATP-binding protein [Terriglobales bacterium]